MTTILDTQESLRLYLTSRLVGGKTKPNGQSDELKAELLLLYPYTVEFLELPSTTLISDLPDSYRSIVENIDTLNSNEEFLEDDQLDIEKNVFKDVDITDYRFPFSLNTGEGYRFSFAGTSNLVPEKLHISQRVGLYKDTSLLSTLWITDINYEQEYFEVESATNLEGVEYALINYWWSKKDPTAVWVDESCFEPSKLNSMLYAKLYSTNRLYGSAWSLYYTDTSVEEPEEIEVAKGVDNIYPGYAYISRVGHLFKAGTYKLKGNKVRKNNYQTNVKTVTWELSRPRTELRNE